MSSRHDQHDMAYKLHGKHVKLDGASQEASQRHVSASPGPTVTEEICRRRFSKQCSFKLSKINNLIKVFFTLQGCTAAEEADEAGCVVGRAHPCSPTMACSVASVRRAQCCISLAHAHGSNPSTNARTHTPNRAHTHTPDHAHTHMLSWSSHHTVSVWPCNCRLQPGPIRRRHRAGICGLFFRVTRALGAVLGSEVRGPRAVLEAGLAGATLAAPEWVDAGD